MQKVVVKKQSGVICLECGETLISKSIHDLVQCNCSNKTFADGGTEYLRFKGGNMEKIVKVPVITTTTACYTVYDTVKVEFV